MFLELIFKFEKSNHHPESTLDTRQAEGNSSGELFNVLLTTIIDVHRSTYTDHKTKWKKGK